MLLWLHVELTSKSSSPVFSLHPVRPTESVSGLYTEVSQRHVSGRHLQTLHFQLESHLKRRGCFVSSLVQTCTHGMYVINPENKQIDPTSKPRAMM